jgi:hypothetical protein
MEGKVVLKNGNTAVMNMLSSSGGLLHREEYKHRYPYDWRTKKPIIFRATNQLSPFSLLHSYPVYILLRCLSSHLYAILWINQ